MQKGILLLLAIVLFFSTATRAQNYKWVKGGGGINFITQSHPDEASYALCTDKHGNVYSMNIVGEHMVAADTFSYLNFGGTTNVLVTSYNCEGQMRWAKFIRAAPQTVRQIDMEIDTSGNLYIAVRKHAGTLYIDNDTVINMLDLRTALIQFDTSGNFNWVRFVGTNNAANWISYFTYGVIAIDMQENIHLLGHLGSGAQLSTSITSERGIYDFVYDNYGNSLDITRLDMDSVNVITGAVFDTDNKLFITGFRSPDFVTTLYPYYVASFDAGYNKIRHDTMVVPYAGLVSLDIDRETHHLYFAGTARDSFAFHGMSVVNTINDYYISFIMKTDTAFDPVWITDFDGTHTPNFLKDVVVMPGGGRIASAGAMVGLIVSNTNDSLKSFAGEGQQAFFTIVDSAGSILKLEQLHGDGFYDGALRVQVDKNSNLYIGGKLELNLWGDTLTPYVSHGGNSDFFIMKYGYNCDCVTPEANYTFSVNMLMGNFTFSGSIIMDSLVWDFGDGNSQTTTGTTTTHTYPNDDSTYTVCVTIHNECGTATYCDAVYISAVSISNIEAFRGVQVYPNPSDEYIMIDGAQGMNAALYNVMGQQVYRGPIQGKEHSINIVNLSSGTYLLQLTTSDGTRMNMTVVKQ